MVKIFFICIFFHLLPQQRVMNCVNSRRFPTDKGTFSALDPPSERGDMKLTLRAAWSDPTDPALYSLLTGQLEVFIS